MGAGLEAAALNTEHRPYLAVRWATSCPVTVPWAPSVETVQGRKCPQLQGHVYHFLLFLCYFTNAYLPLVEKEKQKEIKK